MIITQAQVDALREPDFRVLVRHVMARMLREHSRLRCYRIKPTSIASLEIGETRTFPFKHTKSGLGNRPARARKQLNQPDASWSYRTTNQGVRITRTR